MKEDVAIQKDSIAAVGNASASEATAEVFSEWVHRIAVAAKCDTKDKFDEFFLAVLGRAGLLDEWVDIAEWKSVLDEHRAMETSQRAIASSELVASIAVSAKCDTSEKFEEFFRTLLIREGLLAEGVDISEWESVFVEHDKATKMRRANTKALKVEVLRLRKENNELHKKLRGIREKYPEESFDEEAKSAMPSPKSSDPRTKNPVLNELGEDISMDFDD